MNISQLIRSISTSDPVTLKSLDEILGVAMPPDVLRVNYLDAQGASAGLWYGANATPAWVKHPSKDEVWGIIQRYNFNNGSPLKENWLYVYDLKTRSGRLIGSTMTDDGTIVGSADQHGVGVIKFDKYEHGHVHGGGHNQPMKHTIIPAGTYDIVPQPNIGDGYTYAHPVSIDDDYVLICRLASTGTYPGIYRKAVSLNKDTGAISWSAEQRLVDFQTDTRVYFGTHGEYNKKAVLSITRANAADSIRIDTYLAYFDPKTETLSNLSGTKVLTKAQLPLTRADADAFFRVVDQTTAGVEQSNTPTIYIDAEGIHLLSQGGAAGTEYQYRLFSMTGDLLEGPKVTGTAPYRYVTANIGPVPGGGIEVLYPTPDPAVLDMDTDAVFESGGSIHRVVRTKANTWTAPEVVMQTTRVHPLDGVARVEGGPPEFRFAFCERAIEDKDFGTGGTLRSFGWGSTGLVTTPFIEDEDAKQYIASYKGSYQYTDKDRIRVTNAFRGIKAVGWNTRSDLSYLVCEPVMELSTKELFGGVPLVPTGPVDFVPYEGIKSTTTGKLEAAFNPSTATNKKVNGAAMQVMVAVTENVQSASSDVGTTAGTASLALGARGNTGNLSGLVFHTTAITQAVPKANMIVAMQRSGGRNEIYWRAKKNVKAANVATPTIPNGNFTVGGNGSGYSQRRVGYVHIGAAVDVGPIMQVVKRYIHEASLGS